MNIKIKIVMNEINESTIRNSLDSDKNLSKALMDIQNLEKTQKGQAKLAFNRLYKLYNVAKNPEDIDDENEESIGESSAYE